jgi:preprotein translocase subunit YajC
VLRAIDRHPAVLKEQPVLVYYVLIIYAIVAFLFFRYWNAKKKQQSARLTGVQSSLAVGAEVRTIGGIVGVVTEVTDEHVLVETTPGVILKFTRNAIAGFTLPEIDEGETPDEDSNEHEETEAPHDLGTRDDAHTDVDIDAEAQRLRVAEQESAKR